MSLFYNFKQGQLLGMKDSDLNVLAGSIFIHDGTTGTEKIVRSVERGCSHGDFDYCGSWNWCGVLLDSFREFGISMENNCIRITKAGSDVIFIMGGVDCNYKRLITISFILINQGVDDE